MPDGTWHGGARFKRHDKEVDFLKDAKGNDLNWDESKIRSLPQQQLDGLKIFDILVANWDAQTKNCKIARVKGPNGPEDWYVDSDMGASFADKPQNKFMLDKYRAPGPVIKGVSGGFVEFNFASPIHAEKMAHNKLPLAHAQWFRGLIEKLTDDEIQAAFDAGFATDGLNRAYLSGDAAQIKAAREKELSPERRTMIAGFVAAFRGRIEEFKRKVPAAN